MNQTLTTKIANFLAQNNRDITEITWARKGEDYITTGEFTDMLQDNFLGNTTAYGNGLVLTIISDFEPHTGEPIVEIVFEDFKAKNFAWTRV